MACPHCNSPETTKRRGTTSLGYTERRACSLRRRGSRKVG